LVETVVYVSTEVVSAMKPRANTGESTLIKPFWTVVARGGTGIRSDIVVTVGTIRSGSDLDGYLSLCF
jgi:hypothetical protein